MPAPALHTHCTHTFCTFCHLHAHAHLIFIWVPAQSTVGSFSFVLFSPSLWVLPPFVLYRCRHSPPRLPFCCCYRAFRAHLGLPPSAALRSARTTTLYVRYSYGSRTRPFPCLLPAWTEQVSLPATLRANLPPSSHANNTTLLGSGSSPRFLPPFRAGTLWDTAHPQHHLPPPPYMHHPPPYAVMVPTLFRFYLRRLDDWFCAFRTVRAMIAPAHLRSVTYGYATRLLVFTHLRNIPPIARALRAHRALACLPRAPFSARRTGSTAVWFYAAPAACTCCHARSTHCCCKHYMLPFIVTFLRSARLPRLPAGPAPALLPPAAAIPVEPPPPLPACHAFGYCVPCRAFLVLLHTRTWFPPPAPAVDTAAIVLFRCPCLLPRSSYPWF